MMKNFPALVVLAASALACGDDKPTPTPTPTTAAQTTSPMTGLPSNTGVLSAKAGPPEAVPVATAAGSAGARGFTYSGVQLDPSVATVCKVDTSKAYFEYDSANVKGSDMTGLDGVATCVKTGALKGKTLEVVGHADARGDAEYNKQLGHSRAQSVVDYLAGQGVDKTKLAIVSKGEENADAKPSDTNGMAHDRRVDIRVKKLAAPGDEPRGVGRMGPCASSNERPAGEGQSCQ